MALNLSADGQYFIHTCERCGFKRQEPVDPEKNPHPFEFIMHCYCGQLIDYDFDAVFEVQQSYRRAKLGRPR